MTRVALKGMASRPLRTLLTTLAIVLGVGMVSAAFTLTDTMRGAADSLSSAAYDGTDGVVSARTAFAVDSASDFAVQKPTVDAGLLETVRAVPQVGAAVGDISDQAQIIGRDGEPVGDGPYFGSGFDSRSPGAEKLTAFRLQGGRWATGPGEVVIDATTAEKQNYGVGDRVRISTRGQASAFQVVGVARFGTVKSLGTATAAVFDLATAQHLFKKDGHYDSILVAGRSGTAAADVRSAVAAAVGRTAQVQTAAAHDRFTLDGLKMFIGIIKTVLLVFGGVAILVGAFTIFNTLSITVAQRTREFAMLRMVGAARRQVLGSVLIEALALGLGASIIGIGGGLRARRRPQRGLRCDGPRPARVGHGVRGPDGDRGAARRHARDAGGRRPAGAARDEDRSRERAARRRSGGPAAAPPGARRAGGGLAARPARGRDRRLRRAAGAPQRDAPPGSHRGDRERADDRRDARDRRHRDRQRPAPGDQGHARRPHRGVARGHRAGRLVADRSRDRAHCGRLCRASARSARCARTAASWPATRRSSTACRARNCALSGRTARTRSLSTLGTTGAVVDDGWATEHGMKVGDTFTLTSAKGVALRLRIRGIEESPVLDSLGLGPITVSTAAFDRAFDDAARPARVRRHRRRRRRSRRRSPASRTRTC